MGFCIKIGRTCYSCRRYHRILYSIERQNGETPLHDFEHILAPWSSFVILPLFAFANAGVSFDGIDSSMLSSPLLFAISLGLNYGKPLGVFGFSYLSVKLGIAKLPQGINFKTNFAVAILCGIGFTHVNVLSKPGLQC